MRQERIEAIGGEMFGLLISLLRPVVRRQAAGESFQDGARVSLPPQRVEARVTQSGKTSAADVRLWLRCPAGDPLVFAWVLPLPTAAVVESLELRTFSGGGERAGLCERREARNWFDLARRSGLPGALLGEDAPGIFSLEVASPGGGSLCIRLRYGYRGRVDEGDGEMSIHCEAGVGGDASSRGGARILRIGSGRRLDSILGIAPNPVRRADEPDPPRRDEAESCRSRSPHLAAVPNAAAEVFATYDRIDGGSAMFRGALAGRRVRLWADVRSAARAADAPAANGPHGATELDQLMNEYRRADRTDAERRELATRVVRLGLQAGLATLWTSFVAVVGEGPGGEMAFAAA